MTSKPAVPRRLDSLVPLQCGVVLLAIAACAPRLPPLKAGARIACGGFGSPAVDITLDSRSALASGSLTIEPLEGPVSGNYAIVEYGSARCSASGGRYRITTRQDSAVVATLRIAAAQPVPITVQTADGASRGELIFDPGAGEALELGWDALQ